MTIRKVLIADDVADIRRLIRLLLGKANGFEVVGEAADGAEALALCKELTPDVVLLDMNMPVRSGLDVLPDIRAAMPEAVVVVFSGFEASDLRDRTLALGADDYIEKGTPTAELVVRLKALTSA